MIPPDTPGDEVARLQLPGPATVPTECASHSYIDKVSSMIQIV